MDAGSHRPWLPAGSLVVLLAMACAPRTTVTGNWHEPRPSSIPYNHILVVGISPNSRIRRGFEQAMVQAISTGGTAASASVQFGDTAQALTAESVADMIRASGADAVIVTRIVSRKVALKETPGHVGVKTEQPATLSDAPGLVELFSTTYDEYEEPGELTTKSTAVLNTSLYSAADATHAVYSLVTQSRSEENGDDVIADVTDAIAGQLRHERLIR